LWSYTGAGALFAWGRNNSAGRSLGLNDAINRSSPTQVPGTTWKQVFTPGYSPSVQHAIKTDGTLWSWGYNSSGSLGTPAPGVSGYSSPIQIGSDTTWKSVAKSMFAAGAIKTDGTLWMWGQGSNGKLAQNNTTSYSSPKQIPGTTWKIISGTYQSFTAIKTDGTLWEWGRTSASNLPTNSKYSSPIQIGSDTTWSTFANKVGASGALKTDGTLWMWGENQSGQLGINDTIRRSSPVQVPGTWTNLGGNGQSNYGTKSDGTLWTWGYNEVGNLGQNSQTDYSSPVQIPGTTWNNIFAGGEAASSSSTVATKTDGTLWAWGYGANYGQLGLNDLINRSSPTQIGSQTDWANATASYAFAGWAVTQSN
jgi:alpha-tubulin suppressor-like RCC1 family protein